jgi:hypothetical protein
MITAMAMAVVSTATATTDLELGRFLTSSTLRRAKNKHSIVLSSPDWTIGSHTEWSPLHLPHSRAIRSEPYASARLRRLNLGAFIEQPLTQKKSSFLKPALLLS